VELLLGAEGGEGKEREGIAVERDTEREEEGFRIQGE